MAIQYSLIEFLESTVTGLSYRYIRDKKKERLGLYEYSDSRKVFVNFLRHRQPFCDHFTDQTIAGDFYSSVRCGLLHEARTKNGWTIKARAPKGALIDAAKKIVYRNNFQLALVKFIECYKEVLLTDVSLQAAFIRKFDSLCQ